MKAIKILTHPYTLITSFLLILISGEHLGGFYIVYLLLALPYGGVHSVLALIGIVLLLFGRWKFKGSVNYMLEPIINVIGALLLFGSLFWFFYNDKDKYNYGTFYQLVPQMILVLFSLILIAFIVNNLVRLIAGRQIQNGFL